MSSPRGGLDVPCTCRYAFSMEGGFRYVRGVCEEPGKSFFVCAGCHRNVPWCFGAADHMPHYCDGCWVEPIVVDKQLELPLF